MSMLHPSAALKKLVCHLMRLNFTSYFFFFFLENTCKSVRKDNDSWIMFTFWELKKKRQIKGHFKSSFFSRIVARKVSVIIMNSLSTKNSFFS
jgi:uncharacterized membrane protein